MAHGRRIMDGNYRSNNRQLFDVVWKIGSFAFGLWALYNVATDWDGVSIEDVALGIGIILLVAAAVWHGRRRGIFIDGQHLVVSFDGEVKRIHLSDARVRSISGKEPGFELINERLDDGVMPTVHRVVIEHDGQRTRIPLEAFELTKGDIPGFIEAFERELNDARFQLRLPGPDDDS